jgi:hypothetical protein
MCPIRGKVHVKETSGQRNRTMNQAYNKEHQSFRTWAVNVGEFERNAMAEMANNGIVFYETANFRHYYDLVSYLMKLIID